MSKKLTNKIYSDEELGSFSNKQLSEISKQLEANSGGEQKRKKQEINLLHEFNDLKDATQIILGALASMNGLTTAKMHMKYNLPLKE